MLVQEKNTKLKKHVGAIHSASAMSLLQRKIANGLLYNAYDELMIKDEHRINIKDLCALIGFSSNDRGKIKEAMVDLLSTVIEWNLVDRSTIDQEGIWNASSMIADVSIDGSICTYSYSNKMKQLLYHPDIYGRLDMAVQARFKSSYGLALYENCIRYQSLESTPWIDFCVFRKLMGVGEGGYIRFCDFNTRVIKIAVNEVNLYADIFICVEIQKKQKGVVSAIRFIIRKKEKSKLLSGKIENANGVVNQDLYAKLSNTFGLSSQQISEVLSKHSEEYISEKVTIVETSASFLNGKIKNLARYFQKALEKDFKPPKASGNLVAQRAAQVYLEHGKAEKIKRIQEEYSRYVRMEVLRKFGELQKSEQEIIIGEFLTFYADDSDLSLFYKQKGLSSGYVTSKFVAFIREKGHFLLEGVLDFDCYSSSEQRNIPVNAG